jgi:hypothetical protein
LLVAIPAAGVQFAVIAEIEVFVEERQSLHFEESVGLEHFELLAVLVEISSHGEDYSMGLG